MGWKDSHFNLCRLPEYTGWLWNGIKPQKLASFVGTRFKKIGSTKEQNVIPGCDYFRLEQLESSQLKEMKHKSKETSLLPFGFQKLQLFLPTWFLGLM